MAMARVELECEMDSSQEELLVDVPAKVTSTTRRRTWAAVACLATLCATFVFWHKRSELTKSNLGRSVELVETVKGSAQCRGLPFIQIEEVVSSNLGKKGPDFDAEEGIIYKATPLDTGADDVQNFQIHVHSLVNFEVTEESEDSYDKNYQPAFTSGEWVNGIHGNFAVINVKQGKSLMLRAHAYDADKKEDVLLPHADISFFDLDTGRTNNHSVEHVKIAGYSAYYLSNETQLKTVYDEEFYATKEAAGGDGDVVRVGDGFTGFYATLEGTGDDNPKEPTELTKEQKDRAVTVEFKDITYFDFELGVSPGYTSRVFSFVFRPSLLCAQTVVNKHFYPAKGKTAPVVPVEHDHKSGATKGFVSTVALGAMCLLAQLFA